MKHTSSKISISSLLTHSANRKTLYDKSFSDLAINTLLLLTLSSKEHLIEILGRPEALTQIIQEFISHDFTEQI